MPLSTRARWDESFRPLGRLGLPYLWKIHRKHFLKQKKKKKHDVWYVYLKPSTYMNYLEATCRANVDRATLPALTYIWNQPNGASARVHPGLAGSQGVSQPAGVSAVPFALTWGEEAGYCCCTCINRIADFAVQSLQVVVFRMTDSTVETDFFCADRTLDLLGGFESRGLCAAYEFIAKRKHPTAVMWCYARDRIWHYNINSTCW